ncbi:MAG: CDP-alcohol phosphatidyltransferase family protein [Archangiaceae bacterium]|nr:CDP-alcohol phosphatidyltransferase family protein [Archangiaceae bacterium]
MIPRWLPNAISLVRIGLVPVWLALAFTARARSLDGESVNRLPIVVLLIVLGATDVADGMLARRFALATNFGAMLDAVADKLATFVGTTFLTFFVSPAFAPLPVWLWAALLARDALLGTGWVCVWLRRREVHVKHEWHGKAASVLLFALVVAASAAAPGWLIFGGAVVVLALVVPGTWAYMREGWRQLTAKGAPQT